MPPIPPVATAFALSTPTPSVILDPDSVGQAAPVISQHLVGTGGVLFAVVALVSVASYFYHGRGTVNHARTNNTWASLTCLLSSIRHRGSAATSAAGTMDWAVDVEAQPGFENHVSMVYARYFHPAFWNLVDYHPGTSSTPTIYVEDEASENPVPDPTPPGVKSFLDMNDDDSLDGDDNVKHAREKPNQARDHGFKDVPPYDTSSPTNVSFRSEIIGTTIRQDAFLLVPGELEDSWPETSPSNSELDPSGSPCDGILTADPGPDLACSPYDGISTEDYEPYFPSSPYDGISTEDCEPYFPCSPYDGISTTDSEPDFVCLPYDRTSAADSEPHFLCSPYDGIATNDSQLDISCSLHDGTVVITPGSVSDCRRYGMVDMADLAQKLKDRVSAEGCPLIPMISRGASLTNPSSLVETGSTFPCEPLQVRDPVPEKSTITECGVSVHDTHETLVDGHDDVQPPGVPYSGVDFMRQILAELRDPDLDCTPRALSEDRGFEYLDGDEEQASVPCPAPPWVLRSSRRSSLESTLTLTPGSDSDVSDEGPIYPLTPPSELAASMTSSPDDHKYLVPSPIRGKFDEEATIRSPVSFSSSIKAYVHSGEDSDSEVSYELPIYPSTPLSRPVISRISSFDVHKDRVSSVMGRLHLSMSLDSPPSLPVKAYVHSSRNNRSLPYGPPVPLASLPRL